MLTILLVVVIFALLAYVHGSRRKELNRLSEHGIFVPPTNILLGNFKESHFSGKPSYLVQTEWVKKYGKIYGKYRGLKMRVVVADLDVIHRVLIKDFHFFTNRPEFATSKSLINQENDQWKGLRRIMSPTFSASKMKKMFEFMADCVDLTVSVVDEKAKSRQAFDMYGTYQGLTLDVIGRCALAMDIDCQRNQKNAVLEMTRQFFQPRMPVFLLLAMLFPSLEKLFFFMHKLFSSRGQIERYVFKNVARVVTERRGNPEAYKKVVDVLQLLLEAQKSGGEVSAADSIDGDPFSMQSHKNEEKPSEGSQGNHEADIDLSDDVIEQNAWLFLLAGYETTSSALAFCTYHLARHPEVQERIREELREVTGLDDLTTCDRSSIDYSTVGKLEYLQRVIDESLRINPPVVEFVSRRCGTDYPIPGYEGQVIPKDATVEIPVWQIHHDPEIYPNPEVFDPERFPPEEKAKRHPMAFLPFGAGPRICIGMRFALLEVRLCLARLLAKYTLVPDGQKFKDPLPPVVQKAAFLNPRDGIWVKAVPVGEEIDK